MLHENEFIYFTVSKFLTIHYTKYAEGALRRVNIGKNKISKNTSTPAQYPTNVIVALTCTLNPQSSQFTISKRQLRKLRKSINHKLIPDVFIPIIITSHNM